MIRGVSRPFLYPNFTWAYKKIERSIVAIGERGKKVPGACGEQERDWSKKDGLNGSASRTFCRLVRSVGDVVNKFACLLDKA